MLNSPMCGAKAGNNTSTPPEIFGLKGSSAKELHLRAEQVRYWRYSSFGKETLLGKIIIVRGISWCFFVILPPLVWHMTLQVLIL